MYWSWPYLWPFFSKKLLCYRHCYCSVLQYILQYIALVLKVRQSENRGIPYHTDSRSIKASVCITITVARRAFSWAGTIKSFLASLQWEKKRYFLYICSWRVRFGERRGKQDYSHQVSPEHNPSIADHTHTAELESVLSLSVLVLGFLP